MSKKPKRKRVNWKKAAIELAQCAVFTLAHYKHLGRGSGVVYNFKTHTTEGPWQEKYFNALDLVGYEIDRKKYYASMEKTKRSRR